MEAKLCILNSTGMSSCLRPAYELRSGQWKLIGRKTGMGRRTVVSVIEKTREEENFDGVASCETTTGTVGQKEGTTTTVYRDNWFDRLAIRHLSHSIQATTGIRNEKKGYDSLMESASVVARNFNSKGQQDLVIQSLQRAFPRQILQLIRILLPPSKFTREYFAIFTTIFFSWLVGPCEVKESEFEGRKEKNVVHIKKCRFLEGTSCVGMCTNMCKVPSQKFIKDSLGVPVNMVPNFEDMSCEMIFGQHPPAETDDPAFRQPCYQTLCKVKQTHSADCTSI